MMLGVQRRKRKGYLLVTVVVMIAVAALVLAKMASTSMQVAKTAIEEERELRDRWAISSLRRFTLDGADSLLSQSSILGSESANPTTLWKDIQLAEKQWRVVLADESAKVNVGRLARKRDEQALRKLLTELISGETRTTPVADLAKVGSRARWDTWIDTGESDSWRSPRALATATQNMTLWGNGRLNVSQSNRETIDSLWNALFGRDTPELLHELRQQRPPMRTRNLISALALRESQSTIASQWLTTESHCYSVWVFCQTDRRVRPSLYVEWGGDTAATEHRGYEY